jgi:hypothetical protein
MLLHNLRLGLATNSSSTHSLVFLPRGHGQRNEDADGEFGWNKFTLVSKASKMRYAGVVLRHVLGSLPEDIASLVMERWLGPGWARGSSHADQCSKDDYIDHQSLYQLPFAFGTRLPDGQFFSEFRDYLGQDGVAILGGNDNDDESHPLAYGSFSLPIPQDCNDDFVCRKDGDHWVIFNQKNGDKVRFSFQGRPGKMVVPPAKATAPELVDVKITDWCGFGCPMCYQGSTTRGHHAEHGRLSNLAHGLAALKVFEVACGGGEPTAHPDFADILEDFRRVGIVPNFTTRSLAWLRDGMQWPKIMEACGAFAFSTEKDDTLLQLLSLLRVNGIPTNRASVQVVLGIVGEYDFQRIMDLCDKNDLRLTILGYKAVGRAAGQKPQPYDWWLKRVLEARKQNQCPSIGVDTVVAKEFSKQLLDNDVPEYMFATEEGKFSCYVDAVSETMGPSSYCGKDEMVKVKHLADDQEIARHFAAF